jgi:hypothetical protein
MLVRRGFGHFNEDRVWPGLWEGVTGRAPVPVEHFVLGILGALLNVPPARSTRQARVASWSAFPSHTRVPILLCRLGAPSFPGDLKCPTV